MYKISYKNLLCNTGNIANIYNCKWNIAFKNCDSLFCIPINYIDSSHTSIFFLIAVVEYKLVPFVWIDKLFQVRGMGDFVLLGAIDALSLGEKIKGHIFKKQC